jgi:hypothetical protein
MQQIVASGDTYCWPIDTTEEPDRPSRSRLPRRHSHQETGLAVSVSTAMAYVYAPRSHACSTLEFGC